MPGVRVFSIFLEQVSLSQAALKDSETAWLSVEFAKTGHEISDGWSRCSTLQLIMQLQLLQFWLELCTSSWR